MRFWLEEPSARDVSGKATPHDALITTQLETHGAIRYVVAVLVTSTSDVMCDRGTEYKKLSMVL